MVNVRVYESTKVRIWSTVRKIESSARRSTGPRSSQWVVQLFWAFQDPRSLFLVLELLEGGTLDGSPAGSLATALAAAGGAAL